MDQEELQYDGDLQDESFAQNGDDTFNDGDRTVENELEAIKGILVFALNI